MQDYSIYDEDYFLRGLETGKSLYSNYRWMPDLTIPMAHRIIRVLGLPAGAAILDYGCARGYVVKALRLLDINARGVDVSHWAIDHCAEETRPHLQEISSAAEIARDVNYQAILAKDVLEHISEVHLVPTLMILREVGAELLAIMPLAEDGKYVSPEHENDIGHQIRQPLEWWEERFFEAGWSVQCAAYKMLRLRIKENWIKKYPKGHGFIHAQ
jgi:hypothetical protein